MPPKFDPSDPETAKTISLFQSIGLSSSKATETAKNPKYAASLRELIIANDLNAQVLDEKKASLVNILAMQSLKNGESEKKYALEAILSEKLKSADQISAAVKYLESKGANLDPTEFDEECGVGFSITPEELLSRIKGHIASSKVEGWNNVNSFLGSLRTSRDLRWASPLEVKSVVESEFTELFGPKTKDTKPKKEPKATTSTAEASPSTSYSTSIFAEGFLGKLHKPGGNPQIKPELRDRHLEVTSGQVWTRFPPEPNGFLHIGHSKAILINFGYAAYHNGKCYLRYDDTNPEAEEAKYFDSILETVRWLGFEPWKITYSSDYFQELYELAVELIKRDKAYICHCTGEEIHEMRGGENRGPRRACVHRSRPIAESLEGFENMKSGKYRPGQATLRMKQDLEDGNPQMWDLIAYRNLDAPHHRTKDKWKIYPTYDFTHCLCDSFENISHSLCTTEFVLSRVSYEWLCDALEVYKPRQSEFGRLNVTGTVTSKRKILALVKEGFVKDWDDPRLYTLIALRRRGVPPGAIISFVNSLGVSTAVTTTQTSRLEQTIRSYLENTVPRLMMVLKPLKVTIENLPEDYAIMVDKQLHPKIPELGVTTVPFTRTIYIEADDFRLQDSKDYFRLAPGKTVGLFQAPHPITCVSYKTNASGEVVELICRAEIEEPGKPVKKPKAFIQWVAEHAPSKSPVSIDEVRIFHPLFKSDNPAALPDFRADINKDSLEVIKGSMVEVGFWSLAKKAFEMARKEIAESVAKREGQVPGALHIGNESVRFQGLRVAYFALDSDAHLSCLDEPNEISPGYRESDRIIFNRIVSLKEDAGKGS